MRVVSNTSPIWNLASIRRLDLLREQWHEVLIPAEVLSELRMESGYPETDRIRAALDAQWIRMTPLTSSDCNDTRRCGKETGVRHVGRV